MNNIVLGDNDDKRIQTLDGVIFYPYGIGSGIVSKAKLMRHPKIKEMDITINFDEVTGGDSQEHNPHWSRIPDDPYRILIAGRPVLGKTNAYQPDSQIYTVSFS